MFILVNQCCLAFLSCGVYSNSIWYDVIPMKVAHIILSHPWLYDRDVHHCRKENTYSIQEKKITNIKLTSLYLLEKQIVVTSLIHPILIFGKDQNTSNISKKMLRY